MLKRHWLAFTVFIIVAVWLVWRLLSGSSVDTRRAERPPTAVEIDSATYGPITEIRLLTGTVMPHTRYIIAPKVAGRLLEIRKRIGDPVHPGEVVARLDNEEYVQAVREAEANLAVANASLVEARSSLALARQELERAQSLQQKGVASQSELDVTKTQFEARDAGLKLAEAQVDSRQSSLDLARLRLNYTNLTSSSAGFIGERFVDEGALLPVNASVLSVVTYDRVFIRTSVVDRDYARVHKGMKAQVEVDAFPGRLFPGEITQVAPVIDPNSRNAELEVTVPNDSLLLKPGMFARIRVELNHKSNAQLIPTQALTKQDGQTGVFVVDTSTLTAQYVVVTTGIENQGQMEILDPMLTGPVVTLGQHLLRDGSKVILPKKTTADSSPARGRRP